MEDRKQRILQAIVDDYIATAEPVGSRALARKHGLGLSPATIRNEMSDLEEQGYLEQPHTSAGRVPSDKGYRYYVDHLLAGAPKVKPDTGGIQRSLAQRAREMEGLIRQASRLLAETTEFLSVATGPRVEEVVFRSLQVVPLSANRALLIFVTDDGLVQQKTIELSHPRDALELLHMSRVLTAHLSGSTVGSLSRSKMQELSFALGQYRDVLDQLLAILDGENSASEGRIYLDGATKILKQPEFRNVDKFQVVLSALDQHNVVFDLLGLGASETGVHVAIGHELHVQDMADCSLVSATYRANGHVLGYIGVVGPRRMDYGRVIAMVDAVAMQLSLLLERQLG